MTDGDSHVVRLIQQARDGSQHALGELLDGHRDFLTRLAEQQLDARVALRLDASDVVQQTCLSVHKKIGEFDGSDVAQFVAWIKQIHERNIINVARDHLHAQKRGVQRETPLADEGATPAKQTSASRVAIRSEENARLQAALEHLADDERAVLRLRYLDGLPLTEIEQRMGLTKDALVWLLKRAMKNVRGHFPSGEMP